MTTLENKHIFLFVTKIMSCTCQTVAHVDGYPCTLQVSLLNLASSAVSFVNASCQQQQQHMNFDELIIHNGTVMSYTLIDVTKVSSVGAVKSTPQHCGW